MVCGMPGLGCDAGFRSGQENAVCKAVEICPTARKFTELPSFIIFQTVACSK